MNELVAVVEDDPHISALLRTYLLKAGFEVETFSRGEDTYQSGVLRRASAFIIDLGLAGSMDGFELVRRIRAQSNVPLMIVSARDEELDKLLGLELGADDYVTKPFSPREVVARLKAILRRYGEKREPLLPLNYGRITVDQARREAYLDGNPVPLTAKEYELLCFFLSNRGVAVSRSQILETVWGPEWVGDERTVDVHVRQLRKKFGDALSLSTVWGVGYRLE